MVAKSGPSEDQRKRANSLAGKGEHRGSGHPELEAAREAYETLSRFREEMVATAERLSEKGLGALAQAVGDIGRGSAATVEASQDELLRTFKTQLARIDRLMGEWETRLRDEVRPEAPTTPDERFRAPAIEQWPLPMPMLMEPMQRAAMTQFSFWTRAMQDYHRQVLDLMMAWGPRVMMTMGDAATGGAAGREEARRQGRQLQD